MWAAGHPDEVPEADAVAVVDPAARSGVAVSTMPTTAGAPR